MLVIAILHGVSIEEYGPVTARGQHGAPDALQEQSAKRYRRETLRGIYPPPTMIQVPAAILLVPLD